MQSWSQDAGYVGTTFFRLANFHAGLGISYADLCREWGHPHRGRRKESYLKMIGNLSLWEFKSSMDLHAIIFFLTWNIISFLTAMTFCMFFGCYVLPMHCSSSSIHSVIIPACEMHGASMIINSTDSRKAHKMIGAPLVLWVVAARCEFRCAGYFSNDNSWLKGLLMLMSTYTYSTSHLTIFDNSIIWIPMKFITSRL